MGFPQNFPNNCSSGTAAPVGEWGEETKRYGGYLTRIRWLFLLYHLPLPAPSISLHIPLPTTYGCFQPQLYYPHVYTLLPQISSPIPGSGIRAEICEKHYPLPSYLTPLNRHSRFPPHLTPCHPQPPHFYSFSSNPPPPLTSVGLYNGPQLLLGWWLTHKHTTIVSGTSAESHFIKLVPAFITVTAEGNKLGC